MKQKIYILFGAFLVAFMVICQPISAYCATNIDNFRIDTNNSVYGYNIAGHGEVGLSVSLPDGSVYDFDFRIDLSSDTYLFYYKPVTVNTYLGEMSYLSADLVAVKPVIHFTLPVAKYDSKGNVYYDMNDWDEAYLVVGDTYNRNGTSYEFCTSKWHSFGGVQTRPYDNPASGEPKVYASFMFKNISSYAHPDGLIFTGLYSEYSTSNYYTNTYDYVCYVLQTLKYLKSIGYKDQLYENRLIGVSVIKADGFSHLNTDEYKLYQETLKNAIDKGTDDIENKLDDLNNMGNGQFDDTKNEVNDLTNNIDKNQAILDKVDRVDPDIAGDDLNAIIDNILSDQESVNAFNSILRLFTTNTWFIAFMSIAVCTGVIKYIFFGKG